MGNKSQEKKVFDSPLDNFKNEKRSQDDRFRIMADCAPVMLWMSGKDGRCMFFNQPWLAFSGKTLEEELGYGWAEGVHPEDFQTCMDTFMQSFNARTAFTMEYRLQRADGEYRWILDNGRPYWQDGGEFSGFIGSCIDITDVKKAKELELEKVRLETQISEREKAAVKLQGAYKELEAFSYSVSHDLRAPLRAISGFVDALVEDCNGNLDPKAWHYLEMLKESSSEMNQMIEDLLQFSRLDRHKLDKQWVKLNVVVQQIIEQFKVQYPERNISVSINKLPDAYVDPVLIRNVFSNLIDNAFKYTGRCELSKVDVGFAESEGEDAFYVKDNGDGFDMKYADKLFGVFSRLHSGDEFEGSGVGLAICQRIVNRHGGQIWAHSQKGQGATFYLKLPKIKPSLP